MFHRFQVFSKRVLSRAGCRFEDAPSRLAGGESGFHLWRRRLKGGEPGKRLVVVPGFGDTPLSWVTLLALISARRRFRDQRFGEVVLVEFPGHLGARKGSKVIRSADELTERFCALIDHLAPHTLLGQSMGGYLAAYYAAEGGRRGALAQLILMCPSGLTGTDRTEVETVEWVRDLLEIIEGKPEAFVRKALGALYPVGALRAELTRFLTREDTHELLRSWDAKHSMDHRIERIATPTTLLWGERDELIPFRLFAPWKKALRAAVGPDRLKAHSIPGARHGLHLESPWKVAGALLDTVWAR